MLHSYRNQSIDLRCKSIDWFLHECNIGLIILHQCYTHWEYDCGYQCYGDKDHCGHRVMEIRIRTSMLH